MKKCKCGNSISNLNPVKWEDYFCNKCARKRQQRIAGFNAGAPPNLFGDFIAVCKSCNHVMNSHDNAFWHALKDKNNKPYKCFYVQSNRIKFLLGDPELKPFLRKRDRRSNKRAEKFK